MRVAALAIKLGLRQVGMYRLALLILHHHVIPGGVAQNLVGAQIIVIRGVIQGIFGVNIYHYAQRSQQFVTNLLPNAKFAGNHMTSFATAASTFSGKTPCNMRVEMPVSSLR